MPCFSICGMTHSFFHLPRLFIPMPLVAGANLLLPEAQSHYLKNVMRRADGDAVRVFNGGDGEWTAILRHHGKKAVAIEVDTLIRAPEPVAREVHLFFSPIKKDRNDMLIEKAVELGATHLHPVLFQRSNTRDIKVERVEAQIIEAAEQCERMDIPVLLPLQDLKKALVGWNGDMPVFAAIERSDAEGLKPYTASCGYIVGPEGGVSPEEIEFLCSKSFVKPVSLGPRILRAETAVFYGLSLLSQ